MFCYRRVVGGGGRGGSGRGRDSGDDGGSYLVIVGGSVFRDFFNCVVFFFLNDVCNYCTRVCLCMFTVAFLSFSRLFKGNFRYFLGTLSL